MKGFFITFEGLEGSGKTTQAARLVASLREQGYSAVGTREPGGTAIGESLRTILLDHTHTEMSPLAEVLLFAAIRAQHIAQLIRPALEEGSIVVCDRFVDASLAYQGYGRGMHLTTVREVNEIATWGVKPDFTAYLDMDVEKGLQRMRRRHEEQENIPDRIERENRDFYEKVRQGYQDISRDEPGRVRVFNADLEEPALAAKILDVVVRELRRRNISNKLTLDNLRPSSS